MDARARHIRFQSTGSSFFCGHLQRNRCRQNQPKGLTRAAARPTRHYPAKLMSTPTLESMRADIARILHEDPSEIGNDDNLMDLGLDSMRTMTLASQRSEEHTSELQSLMRNSYAVF